MGGSSRTCTVDGCDKPTKARRLCSMHHTRLLRSGDVGEPTSRRQPVAGTCSESDCPKPVSHAGYCRRHYRVYRLTTNPPCSVDGCEKPWENAGMCGMHYFRTQATGHPGDAAPIINAAASDTPCTVEGCDRPGNGGKGLCRSHRQQVRVYGISPACFTTCCLCASTVDLRTPTGRLRPFRPDLLCEACREAYRKRRKRKWPMTVEQLAERDGSTCSICAEPVDLALRRPDPMSPSVDHYVPRARGGTDIEANLRLAHLVCNVRKGASIPR